MSKIKKEKEKLKTNLELFDTGKNKSFNHTIFVDHEEDVTEFNPKTYFETDERLIENTSNRMKKDQLQNIRVILFDNISYHQMSI